MSDSSKRPTPGTPAYEKWLADRAKKRAERLFYGEPSNLEEFGVISGSVESLTNTDSEAFPNEPEEYRPDEPRLKRVK